MSEENKSISIRGTNNRYQMKKLISQHKIEKEVKKRVVSEKWCFSDECFSYSYQLQVINNIFKNGFQSSDEISKTVIQEINKKISGYKQQDSLKKHYDNDKFITFESITNKMIECELKCRYCNCEMSILYDVSREMKQWSVDRIDNDKGHNIDNFHLACLDCNLKRRRRTDEKFLFTKQLNIIKQDN
jgi:hypothetical protein